MNSSLTLLEAVFMPQVTPDSSQTRRTPEKRQRVYLVAATPESTRSMACRCLTTVMVSASVMAMVSRWYRSMQY